MSSCRATNANALDAWMRRRGVTNVELGEACDVSESIVRDWRLGQRPLQLRRLLRLPARFRRSLLEVFADLEPPSVAA